MISFEIAEAIRMSKARYCRYVDSKLWDELEGLMMPEAKFKFFGAGGEILYEFASAKAMIELSAAALAGARTSHRVCNSELRELSQGSVSAIWAMEDYLVFPRGIDRSPRTMRGYGHYHEIWQEKKGVWLLAELNLERQILEFQPEEPEPRNALS